MSSRNMNDDRTVAIPVTIPAADIDSDGSGDVTLTIGDLRTVTGIDFLMDETGYKLELISISVNVVTARLYRYNYAAADGVAIAFATQSNVSLVNAVVVGQCR